MMKCLSLTLVVALAACSPVGGGEAPASAPVLQQQWRLAGFANPESVALSADGAFLYVSNVNGEGDAKDGNGFISRVSLYGGMIEREFAAGLDAPKGMMVAGDALYVADIDQLVVIDTVTGDVRRRVPAPGARFLNDLTIAPDGRVLVADSVAGRIYATRGDTLEVWLERDLLRAVNGLLAEPNRLLVTTMEGRVLSIDYESRVIVVLAEGLGEADGIAPADEGRYLVSEWPGLMQLVNVTDGMRQTIIDTRAENRFMNDFLRVGDTIYLPHWEPSEVTAYRIAPTAP